MKKSNQVSLKEEASKISFIASECWPLVKVGGLADVVGSLSRDLKKRGVDVSVFIPFYKKVLPEDKEFVPLEKQLKVFFNGQEEGFQVFKTFIFKEKVPVFLIKSEKYFGEEGVYLKSDATPKGSRKEAAKFLFFSKACLRLAQEVGSEILHVHDWQTATIPFLVKEKKLSFKTLLTIHNLGYQGVYPKKDVEDLLGIDFKDEKVNCLKLGIKNADLINTVSPSYAEEILTKRFGCGLENELGQRRRDLTGILNGLDEKAWDPATDPFIFKNYSLSSLSQKVENKKELQKECFKEVDKDKVVLGIVSRLAVQKGLDLVREIMPILLKENIQLVVLGKGRKEYEEFFLGVQKQFPDQVFTKIGFSEQMAHKIYAGCDIFLMPSYYEPCGLGQQIAMKYGAVPVGRKTGGIKDTVENSLNFLFYKRAGTGFLFKKCSPGAVLTSIKRALRAYKDKDFWKKIQEKGMEKDLSWGRSAEEYLKLYEKLA